MPKKFSDTAKKIIFAKHIRFIFSALFGVLIAYLISISSFGRGAELNMYDVLFQFSRSSRVPDSSIVILAIDQNSLQYFKKRNTSWPWPRDLYKITTDYLARAGAKAIVYDFHFNEPDEDRVNSSGAANDSLFAEAIGAAKNVYLAAQLTHFNDEDQPGDTVINYPAPVFVRTQEEFNFDKSYAPLLQFQKASQGIGVVNFLPDEDGVCRRIPLKFTLHQKPLYTLSYQVYKNIADPSASASTIFSPFLIYWYGKGGPDGVFKYYSIHAAIVSALKENAGRLPDIPSTVFKNKIVFIGSNAAGLLDIRNTPFTSEAPYPGVEIHATVLSNLLQHHFIRELSMLLLFVIGLTLACIVSLISNYGKNVGTSTIAVALLAIVVSICSVQLFVYLLWWVKIIFPIGAILFTYMISIGWSFATEGRAKRNMEKIFGRYVNPHVVQALVENPDTAQVGGVEVEATVMFSDIEGFTTISEGKSPRELVQFLNEYFSQATDIVFKHNGTIDKFIGDAVMVLFGAPLPNEKHAIHACRAAYEFSKHVKEMARGARERGEPVFSTRIGINSGKMIVGNIGAHRKMEYTAIGDTVNLSSRLEGVNKFYGTSIIMSETTAVQARDEFIIREMDLIRVKGKNFPITIYELVCKKEEATEHLLKSIQTFESALHLYRAQQWNDAIQMFNTVLHTLPDDASNMYIERCAEYADNPPGTTWDGVYTMKSK